MRALVHLSSKTETSKIFGDRSFRFNRPFLTFLGRSARCLFPHFFGFAVHVASLLIPNYAPRLASGQLDYTVTMVATVVRPYRLFRRRSSFSQAETASEKPHQENIEVVDFFLGPVVLPHRFFERDSSFSQVEMDLKKPHQEAVEVVAGLGGTVIYSSSRFLGRDSSISHVEKDLKKPHQEDIKAFSVVPIHNDEREQDQSTRNQLELREDGLSNRDVDTSPESDTEESYITSSFISPSYSSSTITSTMTMQESFSLDMVEWLAYNSLDSMLGRSSSMDTNNSHTSYIHTSCCSRILALFFQDDPDDKLFSCSTSECSDSSLHMFASF